MANDELKAELALVRTMIIVFAGGLLTGFYVFYQILSKKPKLNIYEYMVGLITVGCGAMTLRLLKFHQKEKQKLSE